MAEHADVPTPRWFTRHGEGHAQWYIERFRTMAADGADLDGEARFVDALLPRGARILDAGCGPGRVAGALHARGHDVLGVDVDPELIAAARTDHPGPRWQVADLATLDLDEPPFDLAVLAGNVLLFVAESTEARVLQCVAAHVRTDGLVVVGFGTDRGYDVAAFDRDREGSGLRLEHRFATWDLRPWRDDADFVVSVFRKEG